MCAIASQTTGPNWLKFFEIFFKISIFFSSVSKIHGQRRALQLVSNITQILFYSKDQIKTLIMTQEFNLS